MVNENLKKKGNITCCIAMNQSIDDLEIKDKLIIYSTGNQTSI